VLAAQAGGAREVRAASFAAPCFAVMGDSYEYERHGRRLSHPA